ncbi:MAG: DUF2237 domain-containing protein [Candidatus Sumerlaeia bacterium]|nr:DUF2237 domain-containing protein [Candidatus Sumerlaeia bacterium]
MKKLNVLGSDLITCSTKPMTGYFRDGCCRTDESDFGSHTVCAVMTAEFLAYTKAMGNDLSTPMPMYDFPGLKPGDKWCVCASRWKEAIYANVAPPVILEACHAKCLEIVPLETLKAHEFRAERFAPTAITEGNARHKLN